MKKRKIKVFEYVKGLKIKGILAPLFKLFEAILELLIPLIIADIIDNGIKNNDKNYIVVRFLFLVILAFVGFGFSITAQYFSSSVASKYSCRIRKGLFSHVQTLSFKELDGLGTSTLLTRITNDTNQIQTGVNMFLRLFLRSPFIVLGALVMAFIVDYQISLIFLGVIIILSLIVVLIMKYTLPKYRKIQSSLDEVTRETKENLTGVRVIRAFTGEEKQVEDFNQKNEKNTKLQIFVSKVSSLMNPLTYLIINIGIILILYFGGIKVNTGSLTNGQVIALYNYINYILVELIKFANLVITITKSIASLKRVEQIFNVEPSLNFEERKQVEGPYLQFDNVSFKYNENGQEALKNISFSLKKNQTLGIIGGTGSGKSTLINLLGHNYDPTSGRIILDGYPLDSYNLATLRNKIGYVPQKAVLFEGTIRSNLLWGNKNAKEEDLLEALKISQSLDIVNAKEKGLDEKVEQGGRNFSGGQKQRLTIARALVKKPEILVLDDSSSALDFKTDKELRGALSKLKNMTVVIISQRTSSLLDCDQILVLDHGELISKGTHEELMKSCLLYQEIHYTQFEKGDK
ncbi:MAG: ABC transporter ATP-binding protein [Bacillales bacterium]|nr:ABC transporter ATP-binding protein [Bacillales bacterium]